MDESRFNSDTTTRGVRVHVEPFFIPEESHPEQSRFIYGYRVTISNRSADTVQLMDRHWIIIDGDGGQEEVEGEGVIGRQPTLAPGETFRYTSICPLPTAWGTMEGTYRMERLGTGGTRESFDVAIGRFVLATGVVGAST